MRGTQPLPIQIIDGIQKKECHWCHEFKSLDNFYNNNRYTHGLQPYCKLCFSTYFKFRNTKKKNREDKLKKYNLTIQSYEIMYAQQGGKCAICDELSEKLDVDHNHITHKVRGLLCGRCNKGLGHFEDNILLLHKAAQYLLENE
jgi:hypothetical protein